MYVSLFIRFRMIFSGLCCVIVCVMVICMSFVLFFFFFQEEDGIRDAQESRGLGDVYKGQDVQLLTFRKNRFECKTYPPPCYWKHLSGAFIGSIKLRALTAAYSKTDLPSPCHRKPFEKNHISPDGGK